MMRGQTAAPSGDLDRWNAIASKNALTGEGKPPVHLKLDLQIFDLQGKLDHTGTLEYWWAASHVFKLKIDTPLEHVTYPGAQALLDDGARRENYLVRELLDNLLNPMAHLSSEPPRRIFTEDRKLGKVSMTCEQSTPASLKKPDEMGSFVCFAPDDASTVRSVSEAGKLIVRNKMGTFRDSTVALDLLSSYNGLFAAHATVTVLQTFTPKVSSAAVATAKAGEEDQSAERLSQDAERVCLSAEGFFRLVTKSHPMEYPSFAGRQPVSGTVMIHITISADGHVQSMFPIASPDPALTRAVEHSLKDWLFRPYLVNQKPMIVEAAIPVDYALAGFP